MYKIIYEHEHINLYSCNSVLQVTDISKFQIKNNVQFLQQNPIYLFLVAQISKRRRSSQCKVKPHSGYTTDMKVKTRAKYDVEAAQHKEQILYYDVVYKGYITLRYFQHISNKRF